MVDKIINKKATLKDKDAFLEDIRTTTISEEAFLQEYMCVPVSNNADYWLPWELITNVESKEVFTDSSTYKGGKTIIGHDIAIRGDNSVFVVFELIGDVAHLLDLKVLKQQKFIEQEQVLKDLVTKYNPYRIYIDQTGMGEKVVEDYKRIFGNMRVQGILFNLASKQEMAVNAKQIFEDKKIRLPFANEHIRSDLRSIKKEHGSSNIPKFTTERNKGGHGDIAWAIFLALLGMKQKQISYDYKSIPHKEKLGLRSYKGIF
ncbi:Terminase-like family protein [Candidatus Hepatincolaceae symbiont of Richtersius coronifer]